MTKFMRMAVFLILVSSMSVSISPAMAGGLAKITDIQGGGGASQLIDTITLECVAADNTKTIYFGNYWQSTAAGYTPPDRNSGVYYWYDAFNKNNYNKEGIKWRVLANDDSGTGQMLILSDKALYADEFNHWSVVDPVVPDNNRYGHNGDILPADANKWATSDVRTTLNNTTATTFGTGGNVTSWGGFAGDAFSAKEYAAIADTSLSDVSTTDKIFYLNSDDVKNESYGFSNENSSSKRDVSATDAAWNVIMYNNTWPLYKYGEREDTAWGLRTLGTGNLKVSFVNFYEVGADAGITNYMGVRPALNLSQEAIVFLSSAKDGKKLVTVGSGFSLADYDGSNGWKLTLKDAYNATTNPTGIKTPNVTTAEVIRNNKWDVNELAETAKTGTKIIEISDQTPTGGELEIAYDDAATGERMYVSALLKDGSGNYVNYAKVSQLATDTKIIDVSGITAADYTLCIYGEQENGDYQTDYASALSEHPITISETVNKILSSDYAAGGLTAKISNGLELGFEAGEYDTAVTVENGKSGKITADAASGTMLTGDISVGNGATLTTANSFTLTGVENKIDGTLKGDALNITDGTTTVSGTGSIENDLTISGGTLELNADKYLATGGVEKAALDGGTIRFTGGTLENDVTGTGTTEIAGEVTANAKIDTTITVDANGQFTATADNLGGNVTNNGIVNFMGGTLVKSYTSNGGTTNFKGKTKFSGAVSLTNNSILGFYLDNFSKGDTIIDSAETINVAGTEINLYQDVEGKKVEEEGDKLTLINKAEGYEGTKDNPLKKKVISESGMLDYEYDTWLEGEELVMGVQGGTPIIKEKTKSFSEARLAGMAAINNGSDLIAAAIMDDDKEFEKTKNWKTFAVIKGSRSHYETGSHIDLNGTSVAAGLSNKIRDNVTLGVFVEGGNGRYTTENEFETGSVRADGDVNYFGGGVFVKAEGRKTAKGQLHGEASIRGGHISSDYNSETFNPGESTRFDTSGAYLGAHAGIGYKWSLKDSSNVDTYVKYLWNRQNGDSMTIDGNEFDLDAVNSRRLRAGFRYNSKENDKGIKIFGGLAYEYEFDGKASGHMGEYSLLEPDFKGGSGMAELGFKYDKADSPWKAEIGLTGYTGKRDSIGATLSAWHEFGDWETEKMRDRERESLNKTVAELRERLKELQKKVEEKEKAKAGKTVKTSSAASPEKLRCR